MTIFSFQVRLGCASRPSLLLLTSSSSLPLLSIANKPCERFQIYRLSAQVESSNLRCRFVFLLLPNRRRRLPRRFNVLFGRARSPVFVFFFIWLIPDSDLAQQFVGFVNLIHPVRAAGKLLFGISIACNWVYVVDFNF